MTPPRPTGDSLKKRYGYKLVSNGIGLVALLGTQAIVPRALGPADYGLFGYLTNFFTQTIELFDAGVTLGFYTKLAQRPGDHGLVRFNWGVLAAIGLLVVGATFLLHQLGLGRSVWLSTPMRFVYLAIAWCLLSKGAAVVGLMADAHGLTTSLELGRNLQRFVGLSGLLALAWWGGLRLSTYFLYGQAMSVALVVAGGIVLRRHGFPLWPRRPLTPVEIKGYAAELGEYATPLLWLTAVGMVVSLLDRWLLQAYGGAVQQGFYGFSMQMGSLCFVFAASLTPLLMREMSKASAENDRERQRHLFLRLIPPLFSVSAFFGLFLAFQADRVIDLFAGGRYHDARLAVAVMCLYPLHQTYGQLSGSVFYSTGQTRLYRNIGVTMTLLGLPLTYFFLAPASVGGQNGGAVGLAIKTVSLQFLETNVQLWFNARLLGFRYAALLKHQILSVAVLALCAGGVRWGAGRLGVGPGAEFLGAGVVYTGLVVALAWFFPRVFGFHRDDWSWIRRRWSAAS